MAECGIEKYDELPARVGSIDVDYLRWRLYRCLNPSWLHNIPLIGQFLAPPSDELTKNEVIMKLDGAIAYIEMQEAKHEE